MTGILVILDGLGGRPTDLGGATCLERAATPVLDILAARGALGLMDPVAPGVRPGSDTAHLSIFGYDPQRVYTGRGAFEALGIGMDVRGGDVCFRANFGTVEERAGHLIVLDRRAGRLPEGKPFEDAINGIGLDDFDVEFFFRASTEHRGALVLRGEALSADVSDTDPHEVGVPVAAALGNDPAARRTAEAVNAFVRRAHEVLRDHPANRTRVSRGEVPANAILLRGAAAMPHLRPITEEYGIQGVCIAAGALYKGVAKLAGLTIRDVPSATTDLDTDFGATARAVLSSLEKAEFVFVHIKGADNAGHDGDARAKRAFIERADREFFQPLVAALPWDAVHLCVSGDHTTPPAAREHTADPVPVLFVGPAVRPDRTRAFGERAAGEGGLGRFAGRLVPQLLGYCDLGPKFGT